MFWLNLLNIENQHLFLQCHAAISILISGGKINCLGHLQPQVHLEFHYNVHLCPLFYLKTNLHDTEPFRKESDRSHVYSLFLVNNQHMSICAKMMSSWLSEVLGIAKVYMSLGTSWGATLSVAFGAGNSLLSILQAGYWARFSTTARHYFSTYITTTNWHYNFIVSTLSQSSVCSGPVDKCQTLIYVKSCGYVGLSGHKLSITEQ